MWSKAGYTEYDFMRMKQEAINEAKEMQRRAAVPAAGVSAERGGWSSGQPVQQPVKEERCPRCGRIIRDGKHIYPQREPPIAPNARPTGQTIRQGAPAVPRNTAQNRPNSRQGTAQRFTPNRRAPQNNPAASPSGFGYTYEQPKAEERRYNDTPPPKEGYAEAPPLAESNDAQGFNTKINIPFLGDIDIDRDVLIIGGLLLVLLTEEGSDRMLMLALLYIMF